MNISAPVATTSSVNAAVALNVTAPGLNTTVIDPPPITNGSIFANTTVGDPAPVLTQLPLCATQPSPIQHSLSLYYDRRPSPSYRDAITLAVTTRSTTAPER